MIKKIYLFVPIFLFSICLISSCINIINTSNVISENVLRLHIIANSDNDVDQNIKHKIRDNVLKETHTMFSKSNNIDDAVKIAKSNIELINKISQRTVTDFGCNYLTKTYVTKEYFKTRYYNNFTLPAGYYNTIKIIIGNGEGHNWWCVLYPSVCVSGCIDDFSKVLNNDELNLITNNKYIPKFKIIEIYNKIKNYLLTMN